ncbi:MAG: 2-succinyl-5-enolpyruvyl-6-hydroxy-3-cyclohexene-1-carboxylic-acid synthase [Gammaproteobacteria bacterium]|nr:MAG: 2-succinyl-5-enolpyruvyl-6-hydroxy-3-cyclohexene-1-carboxylic-acid synthase [Gammaproteobacteria bacterium]
MNKFKQIQNIVETVVNYGCRYAIISPGSRNAPLIIAAAQHKKIKTISIVDERVAGFVGLGITLQTKKPVILICTSGTATLNYMPAIAEAYYTDTPLIILTADRPAIQIDNWYGQCIHQKNMYAPYTKINKQLDDNNLDDIMKSITNYFVNPICPMHINIPIDDPIYPKNIVIKYPSHKKIKLNIDKKTIDLKILENFKNKLQQVRKILIIAGFMPKSKKLKKYLNFIEIPIIGDITSNLSNCDNFINSSTIDFNLENKDISADFIITIGNNLLSKSLLNYFKINQAKHHYHIGEGQVGDPFQSLKEIIKIKPKYFFKTIQQQKIEYPRQQEYLKILKNKTIFKNRFDGDNFSPIVKTIIQNLSGNSVLHLGNSTPIRLANLHIKKSDNFKIFCNRGTSGIDGSISTAIGIAMADKKNEHTLIIGDLSFFYDNNALWQNNYPNNLKIIILNNDGGGIFNIITNNIKNKKINNLIKTAHKKNSSLICSHHNINYRKITNKSNIKQELIDFKKGVLEIILQ